MSSDDSQKTHSRRRRIRRSSTTLALIWFVLVSSVLLVAAVVLDNSSWKLSLVDQGASSTLLAYSIAILVAQSQYAEAQGARLDVRSGWSTESKRNLTGEAPFRYVKVENVGRGAATVVSISFVIEAPGDSVVSALSVAALKMVFGDLQDEHDYHLLNLTSRSSLAPGRSEVFFECIEALTSRFRALTVVIRYETALRDLYEEQFSLLPYEGAAPPA